MKLTVKKVDRLKEAGRYGDGYGLYLQINPTGAKSWLFRYERRGKEHFMGLGPIVDFTLEEAREKARDARRALKAGLDPLALRRSEAVALKLEEAKQITFRDAAQRYFDTHKNGWKNQKHIDQFIGSLELHAFPMLGHLSVADIDTPLVLRCLEKIWFEKPETASRVRSRMEKIFGWCAVRGLRANDNPARWVGHLKDTLPTRSKVKKTVNHPSLPYDEVSAFVDDLKSREGNAARALEFLILCASRTSEVTGARLTEFKLDEALWTIPAERMKAGKAHRVPLSPRAVEIIRKLPKERGNPYVFIGGKSGLPLSNMAMLVLLRRMKRADIVVHGFRSSFRNWAAERTNYPREVCEAALAHAAGDETELAYMRSDLYVKRKRLMNEWGRFVSLLTKDTSEVINLARHK